MTDINLEIGRLLAFDIDGMVRLGIPEDEAEAIRDEFRGWEMIQAAERAEVEADRVEEVKATRRNKRRGPRGDAFECYDPDIGVNLTLADLDELPTDDEVDLDSIEVLWAYRAPRFNAFPNRRP